MEEEYGSRMALLELLDGYDVPVTISTIENVYRATTGSEMPTVGLREHLSELAVAGKVQMYAEGGYLSTMAVVRFEARVDAANEFVLDALLSRSNGVMSLEYIMVRIFKMTGRVFQRQLVLECLDCLVLRGEASDVVAPVSTFWRAVR